jgi:hypothetical protein
MRLIHEGYLPATTGVGMACGSQLLLSELAAGIRRSPNFSRCRPESSLSFAR